MEKKFDVSGMTCASCVANVTKAVEKLDGVQSANVNLMTNSMKVNFYEDKVNLQVCLAKKFHRKIK